jgi:cytochrome b subunit of formate dehydrogenase/mono/diheme cytochrome c family protein
MEETLSGKSTAQESNQTEGKKYARFDLSQRVQHFVLLVSFSLLGITGLAQKYATSRAGEAVLGFFGGIEMSRLIHRGAAVVLMAVSIYHLIDVLYRVLVLRVSLSMLPVVEDFQHLYQDILFYVGRRKHKAYYGRYSYAEKVEYLAVVWGTVIMAITGFMMWNPIATARWFPGEIIPASKAAHGGEALLAVLAIILWHFYHVHIRHFNRSIFTGALTEEEMRHEHPAELAQIKSGEAGRLPPQDVIQRRQRYFYPVAAILTAAMTFGLYRFITFEQTAITYVPPGETAPVFVPFTPTPTATALPSPTPAPGGIAANTWQGAFQELFADECGACHVQQSLGGLSLATYQDALEGGASGSAIVPGDPDASVLVQVQATGNHPGQLTIDELQEVIQWIEAGAPEQ